MHQLTVITLGILCLGQSLAQAVRFDNYRVYSVQVENEDHVRKLQSIENVYDFWKTGTIGQHSDIMVSPRDVAEFEKFVENMNSSIKVDNVQRYNNTRKNGTKISLNCWFLCEQKG